MIDLNYGAVPTSRTDCQARLLNLGEGNRGLISAICDLDLNVDEASSTRKSSFISKCGKCGAYPNYLSHAKEGIAAGWVCGFCHTFNESGAIPDGPFYIKKFGQAATGTCDKIALVIDLNCEYVENLEVLKKLDLSAFGAVVLITIEDGTITIHRTTQKLVLDCESYKVVNRLNKLDEYWFISKYNLDSEDLFTDPNHAQDTISSFLTFRTNCNKKRCKRSTALALFLASCCHPTQTIAFIFGPSTVDPGKVISRNRNIHIRSHSNIEQRKDLKYWQAASKFYKKMSNLNSFVKITMFVASMDQAGIWEMKPCLRDVIQYEMLTDENFELDWNTFTRFRAYYSVDDITFRTSEGLKLHVVRGPVAPVVLGPGNHSNASEDVYGDWTVFRYEGPNSNQLCLLTALAVDTCRKNTGLHSAPTSFTFHIEVSFSVSNQKYVAVESKLIPSSTSVSLTESFHGKIMAASIMKQIAYEVLFHSKIYVQNLQNWASNTVDLLRNLDSLHFSDLRPLQELAYFMRRSALLQKRNTSPDEWIIYQWNILISPLRQMFKLVKPHIVSINGSIQNSSDLVHHPQPVLVDGGNFLVVRSATSSDPGTNTAFNSLKVSAREMIRHNNRFPKPWYRETHPGSSQDRFVLARLGLSENHTLNTDDLSLDHYIQLLYRHNNM